MLSYKGTKYIHVKFLATGFETIARSDCIRLGKVWDRLSPSVYGIGFVGVGPYNARVGGKSTRAYRVWEAMLQRCYCKFVHKIRPTYVGCSVLPRWHNFQLFCEDIQKLRGFDKWSVDTKYQLDKDILIEGNKIYGPATCMFVHTKENSAAVHKDARRKIREGF